MDEIGQRLERIERPLEQQRQSSEEGTDDPETPTCTSPVDLGDRAT